MADNLTPEQRKLNMSRIRSRHTVPEILVRSIIHRLGFRFRLHYPQLKGRPDIALPKHKKLILVNGCFWHIHHCKRGDVTPKTNTDYWQCKRQRNTVRDKEYLAFYKKEGWKVLTVWECETKNQRAMQSKLKRFLNL